MKSSLTSTRFSRRTRSLFKSHNNAQWYHFEFLVALIKREILINVFLKSAKRSPPQSSLPNDEKQQRELSSKLKELETARKDLEQKESRLSEREKSLLKREATLGEQASSIETQKRTIKDKEAELSREIEAAKRNQSAPNQKTTQLEAELSKMKEELVSKESRFETQSQEHLKQIEYEYNKFLIVTTNINFFHIYRSCKTEINVLNETIKSLRRDLSAALKQDKNVPVTNTSVTESNANNHQSPRSGASVLPPIIAKKHSASANKDHSTIMFTRLDAVQNIKRLNAALSRGNLNDAELEVGLYNLIFINFINFL